jgi:hypothetical protein
MAESVKKSRVRKSKSNGEADTKAGKAAAEETTDTPQRTSTSGSEPTHEQIAELAQKYWQQRGYTDGRHEEDWLRAEKELRAKAS